jgi:hypothetical protein
VHAPSQSAPGDHSRWATPDVVRSLQAAGVSGFGNDVRQRRTAMESMIACVDDGTKKVVDALKRQQMWENTFMLWSSDNGGKSSEGANNYPLRGNKGHFFEGGVRLVSFVAGGILPPSHPESVDGKIHVADWYATFASLAGLPSAADRQAAKQNLPDVDGLDVWSLFETRNATEVRDEVPLAVFPEGHWCGGGAGGGGDDNPSGEVKAIMLSEHSPTPGAPPGKTKWCTADKRYENTAKLRGGLTPAARKKPKGAMSLYSEESFQPSRAALIVGDYKIVNNGQSAGAGWTKKDFPYSSASADWQKGVQKVGRCQKDFCLFNLADDPEERTDLAWQQPDVYDKLTKRFNALQHGVFQSNYVDPTQKNCLELGEMLDKNKGFVGPPCS